jgi:hypothetical protein
MSRMKPSHDKLYKEAAFVGIALVPMWYVVAQFTTAVRWFPNSEYKQGFDVMLAGALFHLAAEESGLNTFYLTNSYAYDNSFAAQYKDERLPLDTVVDWLRDAGSAFGLQQSHGRRNNPAW